MHTDTDGTVRALSGCYMNYKSHTHPIWESEVNLDPATHSPSPHTPPHIQRSSGDSEPTHPGHSGGRGNASGIQIKRNGRYTG